MLGLSDLVQTWLRKGEEWAESGMVLSFLLGRLGRSVVIDWCGMYIEKSRLKVMAFSFFFF